jgi:hypothetical protein
MGFAGAQPILRAVGDDPVPGGARAAALARRMSGVNGSRECAPDDKLRDTHHVSMHAQQGDGFRKGSTHPTSYPVLDRFVNGLATSIKSIDLNAATYQNVSRLGNTLTRYIDQVATFSGRTWAGAEVRGADITSRALDLAVPNAGSAAQQSVVNKAVQYGVQRGVSVNVIPYP